MNKIDKQEFRQFADYIKANYGIRFKDEKKTLIEGRMGQVLSSLHFDSLAEYMQYVKSDPTGQAAAVMLDRITTNHTFFMREPAHFYYFQYSQGIVRAAWLGGCNNTLFGLTGEDRP